MLQLLIVAEDSHYLWQRLRIERTRTSDPEHLREIVESAQRQRHEDSKADGKLVLRLQEWLNDYGKLKPLEIYQIPARNKLEADVPRLRHELDQFVEAKQLLIANWPDLERPSMKDFQVELGRRAKELGEAAGELGDLASQGTRRAIKVVWQRSRKPGHDAEYTELAPNEPPRADPPKGDEQSSGSAGKD